MNKLNHSHWVDLAVLVLVNLMWASEYPAYQIASSAMDVATLNFWTLLFATALLLPFLILERRKRAKNAPPRPFLRSLVDFLLLGLFGIVPSSVWLAWGISHSNASNGAILSLTIPVMMTLMGVLLLGERFTLLRLAAIVVALVGTLLLSVQDIRHSSFSRNLLLGNLVIFISGVGAAYFNTHSKVVRTRFSEVELLVFSYLVAGSACAIYSLCGESHPFYLVNGYGWQVWVSIAVLGGFVWGLAMVLWMWVLGRLDVAQISVSIYLLPVFGLLLSIITLHQGVGLAQIGGGILVAASTTVLTVYEGRLEKARLRVLSTSSTGTGGENH
jgi:drug/metabolite transporter (DMT)-like permease